MGVIVCAALALLNLVVFIAVGSPFSLAAMAFCLGCALICAVISS